MIPLAWKNIWRQKRRTLFAVFAVAIASILTPLLFGFLAAWQNGMFEHLTARTGHLMVHVEHWQDVRQFEKLLIPNENVVAKRITETLNNIKNVQVATLLEVPALLAGESKFRTVQLTGLDQPSALDEPLNQRLIAGRLPNPNTLEEIVLGDSLAEALEVSLGDTVYTYLAQSIGERIILDTASLEQPHARALRVVGLIKAGIDLVDQNAVLIHIDDARALTEVSSATSIALMVARGSESIAAKLIAPLLPEGVAAYGVWDIVGPIKTDLIGAKLSAIPVGVLLNIFAIITVVSTVLVSVFERKKEFAVMQALGYLPHRLANMVVLESLLATFLGWLFGLSLGYGVAWMFATHNILGRLFAVSGRVWPSTGIAEELYAAVHPIYSLYALTIVILVVLFCILLTAPYVRNIKISEVIRSL